MANRLNQAGIAALVLFLCWPAEAGAEEAKSLLPEGAWKLAFQDDFTDALTNVDARWSFQNGPSGHILCSRWRDNASVSNGVLQLRARKETRAGQAWTAASLWTKRHFKYGYFECRYRYAKATGTNNSFWIMTTEGDGPVKKDGKFEIDINEGHVPDEINMNIHNWSGKHWSKHKSVTRKGADLSDEYHLYGLRWDERSLVWYYDGQEIRRETNSICHRPAPVWLSLAIVKWAGPVTDAIDGASMDVDYVRVYEPDEAR
jgi:beta-glucanase (GH16 family)